MAAKTSMGSRWWMIIVTGILALLIVFMFRPLPPANAENCIAVKGKVVKIVEGTGPQDLELTLENDNSYYYINRGLQYGLKLDELHNRLINQTVTLYYIKHWSLANFDGKTRHIARVELGDQLVYNEWKGN